MGRFISDETRRRLAAGWDPRVSTLREYARQNGVSERTVRLWRAQTRHDGGTTMPGGSEDVPLLVVMDALQARLDELEAAVDAARAAVAEARAALDAVAAASDVPCSTEPAEHHLAPRPMAVERQPMPRPGLTWF